MTERDALQCAAWIEVWCREHQEEGTCMKCCFHVHNDLVYCILGRIPQYWEIAALEKERGLKHD